MVSRLVITFLPRRKYLLISWLQSPSAVTEAPKIKSVTVSITSPSICHELMGKIEGEEKGTTEDEMVGWQQ